MAMRLLSQWDFCEELRKAGLSPTDNHSELGRIWRADTGEVVMVPDLDGPIPDFVLDRVLTEVGRLYRSSQCRQAKETTSAGKDLPD